MAQNIKPRAFMKYFILLFFTINMAFGFELPKNKSEWPIFFRQMPKGGDLHYHFTGSVYPEEFTKIAANKPYCLNKQNWQISTWNKDCVGVNTQSWLNENPNNAKKLIKAWSLTEFYPDNQQSISEHFFKSFYLFGGLVSGNENFLMQSIIKNAQLQNILYLEIIMVPDASKLPDYNEALNINKLKQWAKTNNVDNLVKNYEFINKTKSVDILFQQAILREQPIQRFIPQAILAFALANGQHESVAINIVQPEHGYRALKNYKQHMKIIALLRKIYPNAKIALHAGELTSALASPRNLNFHINDAIFTAHADRIGHGVSITSESNAKNLLKHMNKNHIAVEINLSSNAALLNTKKNSHPMQLYLDNHVPIVLGTDDEGILRIDLSHEYWLAATMYRLDYATIKQINRNSLTYSFIPGKNIWQNPEKGILINECKNLQSNSCHKFITEHPKARLQRKLELALIKFEASYGKKL